MAAATAQLRPGRAGEWKETRSVAHAFTILIPHLRVASSTARKRLQSKFAGMTIQHQMFWIGKQMSDQHLLLYHIANKT